MKKLTGNIKYDLALATILVLVSVIVVQNFPDLPQNVEAFVAPHEETKAEYIVEYMLDKAEQRYLENEQKYRKDALNEVLQETNTELMTMTLEYPKHDWEEYKQVIGAMLNNQ